MRTLSVNLIPRPRRMRQERRRRTRAWLSFLRVYGIVLAVACCLTMLPAHAAAPALDSTLARVDKRIEASSTALANVKKSILDHNRSLEISRAVGDHPDWSVVLDAVARHRDRDITLESFDLTTARVEEKPAKGAGTSDKTPKATPRDVHTIRLSGYAASPAAAFEYAQRLEMLDFADSVSIKDTRSQPLAGAGKLATTHFDIEIVITGGATPSGRKREGGTK